jgi:hypothetical protein
MNQYLESKDPRRKRDNQGNLIDSLEKKTFLFHSNAKNRVAPFVRLLQHRLLKHRLQKHQLFALKHRLVKTSTVNNIDLLKHQLLEARTPSIKSQKTNKFQSLVSPHHFFNCALLITIPWGRGGGPLF